MRRPTPEPDLYAWHSAAMRGEAPPVFEGEPQCGWFTIRLVKGGPRIPASISVHQVVDPETGELEEPEEYRCEVGGQIRDPYRTWISLRPISESDYWALVEAHRVDARFKATLAKIDLSRDPMGVS